MSGRLFATGPRFRPRYPASRVRRQLDFFYKHGLAYAQEMGNRPQTLYGIADSPVGLAAWILDHDMRSHELIAPSLMVNPRA
jgi:hypothetical protein